MRSNEYNAIISAYKMIIINFVASFRAYTCTLYHMCVNERPSNFAISYQMFHMPWNILDFVRLLQRTSKKYYHHQIHNICRFRFTVLVWLIVFVYSTIFRSEHHHYMNVNEWHCQLFLCAQRCILYSPKKKKKMHWAHKQNGNTQVYFASFRICLHV